MVKATENHPLQAFEEWASALDAHADILNLDPKCVAAHIRKLIKDVQL